MLESVAPVTRVHLHVVHKASCEGPLTAHPPSGYVLRCHCGLGNVHRPPFANPELDEADVHLLALWRVPERDPRSAPIVTVGRLQRWLVYERKLPIAQRVIIDGQYGFITHEAAREALRPHELTPGLRDTLNRALGANPAMVTVPPW